ncbi:hypothetical protein F5050DRAFT_1862859 [Lentinula boryana]|uniref:Fungal-type protein kinase domain-containing protein n=1 Tax=Lentinula boryana TaxID=40481 RepID=A0ABQ8PZR3_9AGAR|nr:hypothetical protein F5050DRAFT_1862859 [Lentinula boryana]
MSSVHSSDHGSPPVSQQNLKEAVRYELNGQTWEFAVERLAQALSAKTRKPSASPSKLEQFDTLKNYDLAIDKLGLQINNAFHHFANNNPETLLVESDYPESEHHCGLIDFLNGGIRSSLTQLPKDHEALYRALKFYVWDKPMKDAKSLKPNGAGVLGFKANELDNLFWSPPAEGGEQMAIPVGIRDNWPNLVLQAGIYACCLFSASPLRQFVLVIGYNYKDHTLRFLVYHRGGCTGSEPLNLDQPKGQKGFTHLLASILTWKTRADAGFRAWCNDAQVCLPGRKAGDMSVFGVAPRVFRIKVPVALLGEEALAGKLAAKEKTMLQTSGTGSGLNLTRIVSGNAQKKASGDDDEAVSSIAISRVRVLADKVENVDQAIDWHPSDPLNLAGGDSAVNLSSLATAATLWGKTSEVPEHRSLLGHAIAFVGHSLVSAKDLGSLVLAVVHAHTGYYNMCVKKYQHRNLSIGNVLMVDEPIKTERFDIPNPNATQREILDLCRDLGINDHCTGFVIDGDMAVTWDSYFTEEHLGTKSGTSEFMSTKLLDPAIEDHVHSPVDDYYSFYFLTQWACAFRDLSPEDQAKDSVTLQSLRMRLAGGLDSRDAATHTIRGEKLNAEQYGAFLVQAQPFLKKWYDKLISLGNEWQKINASEHYTAASFRHIAERGLLYFLRVVVEPEFFVIVRSQLLLYYGCLGTFPGSG